ncbi:hypothetical protein [Nocardia stercoris]|nr:hypothetical protein [Nocardia stercoris]
MGSVESIVCTLTNAGSTAGTTALFGIEDLINDLTAVGSTAGVGVLNALS